MIELAASGNLEDPCIVRAEAGDEPRSIYFHGHFDVVPAQRRDQLSAERRDGKIIGRGTADMKGGLVSMVYGAAAAAEFGLLGDGRIVLHFVCDEETGSAVGSGHLRQAGMIDPKAVAMLTPEPTGGVIWHASRGAITLRVELSGREAHVGQAHLGINAFERMVRVAEPLNKLAHDLLQKRTKFPTADDAARGSMLVVGGSAGSGANFNVVPGKAWLSLDRRFNPEEDLDEEMRRLTDAVNAAAAATGATATIDVLQRQPSARTEASHPASIALARCITAVEDDGASKYAPAAWTHAGMHNSASQRWGTAPTGSRPPTAPMSSSTRPPWAGARPSTPPSPARCCSDAGGARGLRHSQPGAVESMGAGVRGTWPASLV